ncbi:hypothetical protein EWM64_g10860 [Hericium alpestre]|uniref:Uncharacterized protein n=1 Tax=Hericium alpestre TaxID=135208 RepID=A0A4Y9ZEY3_9AGAM|nr:hypothetical protein EWM64_g10860 [Hericium alpestre]
MPAPAYDTAWVHVSPPRLCSIPAGLPQPTPPCTPTIMAPPTPVHGTICPHLPVHMPRTHGPARQRQHTTAHPAPAHEPRCTNPGARPRQPGLLLTQARMAAPGPQRTRCAEPHLTLHGPNELPTAAAAHESSRSVRPPTLRARPRQCTTSI